VGTSRKRRFDNPHAPASRLDSVARSSRATSCRGKRSLLRDERLDESRAGSIDRRALSELSPAPEHARFGSGWISGILSAVLGIMSFGAVLCLHFPALLTSPILREYYPMPFMRALIQTVLLLSFGLGALSLILRRRKVLGTVGLSFATIAALMGGAGVEVRGPVPGSNYLGLDWFLLDLFVMGLIFVPMERLFALARQQPIFRKGWRTDLTYFLTSHIGVQMLTLMTLAPAAILFRWMIDSPIQRKIGSQPWWLQFMQIVVLADLAGYWIHRMFHRVPLLWRFHAIHHSSERMDWLAGSRLHLVDIVVTRALALFRCTLWGSRRHRSISILRSCHFTQFSSMRTWVSGSAGCDT
jgi:sterol desaturase/sphingolipid hydroxylase (fatty acid hydroxylase superfamily)